VIRVLVVDDHPLIRRGLTELFAQTPDIRVVAACADGSEALGAAQLTRPDVVLMDLAMPGTSGLEAARQLLAHDPDVRVLMLTGRVTTESVCAARDLGVAGYLLKDDDPGELPAQVRRVAAGLDAWSPAAAAHLAGCGSTDGLVR
jgi:DNA-binding NarL/FixJ family response regulator